MEIGVVGGSGFIGNSIARFLSKEHKVRIIDINTIKTEGNLTFKKCDVLDQKSLENSLKGCDVVIDTHIIQIPRINEIKELAFNINVNGTKNVCEFCRKNDSKLILTGSWHVYGEPPFEKTLIDEEYGYHPEKVSERAKFYVINKIMQEMWVRSYSEIYGIKAGILRLSTVLGQGMPEKTAANIFINQALKNEDITPFRDTRHRPMLYVDVKDVTEAIRRLIQILNSKCEIMHIAYPEPVTILELSEMVKKLSNSKSKIKVVNNVEDIFKPEDKKYCHMDLTRLKTKLKIEKLISVEDSLKRIIENARQNSS
jgi:UDP-glucose 4-epimerase